VKDDLSSFSSLSGAPLAAPDRVLRWDVLELHLEEAGFLWTLRGTALASARFTLPEVAAGPEARLHAHLRALAVGGKRTSDRLLLPALRDGESELRAAAALALLEEGEGRDRDAVFAAFGELDDEERAPVARALEVSDAPALHEHLVPWLQSDQPGVVADALDALTFRRVATDPVMLQRFLDEPERQILAAAVRALRLVPTQASPKVIADALADDGDELRHAGLLSGLIAAQAQAFRACRKLLHAGGETGRLAMLAVAAGGDDQDVEALRRLLESPEHRRDVLWALGFSGRPAAADACLEWLGDGEVGGLAAEAFSAITGLFIAGRYCREPSARPEEDGEDDGEIPPSDEDLPLADPEQVAPWWSRARPQLGTGGRFLRGKPFGLEPLLQELATGPARRRAPLALELAIRSRGAVQVETRAYSKVQHRELDGAAALRDEGTFLLPFKQWR